MSKITDLINNPSSSALQTVSNGYSLTSGVPDFGYAAISEEHINAFNKAQQESVYLDAFKKRYIKIRTDNIALTHEHAIELVKMIERDAGLITYKDTQ